MTVEIINRVANSDLTIFDLEDYYPKESRVQIDIAQWLYEGFLLKEKDFRTYLKQHDWTQYQDQYIAIYCSNDVVIPSWSYALVTLHLLPFAKKTLIGTFENLDTVLYQEILAAIDYTVYQDKPVLIKGCSKKPVPVNAYVLAVQYLQPYVKSIMYGEACSAVPLFKKK